MSAQLIFGGGQFKLLATATAAAAATATVAAANLSHFVLANKHRKTEMIFFSL